MNIQQSNYIKLVAIITMLIDHIGAILFPDIRILRILGRIAFPLFAYQIGCGYMHTKNLKKYMLRLLVFGLCLQLIYCVTIYFSGDTENLGNMNIFFTLFLGLASIYLYKDNNYIGLLFVLVASIIAQHFNITLDYGFYGIVLILILYIERDYPTRMIVFMSIISFLYGYYVQEGDYIQMYCLMSMFFIMKPFTLKFPIPNYVFYLFYPIHLAILYAISITYPYFK